METYDHIPVFTLESEVFPFGEVYTGRVRDERLNMHWFETMEDAKAIIEAWRRDYNETRPHMALNDIAPEEYARQSGAWNAEN